MGTNRKSWYLGYCVEVHAGAYICKGHRHRKWLCVETSIAVW